MDAAEWLGARLEIRCTVMPYRGFESHLLRQMILRPATIDDANALLAWRNDPATRALSHNKCNVERHAHLEWLACVRADRPLCVMDFER